MRGPISGMREPRSSLKGPDSGFEMPFLFQSEPIPAKFTKFQLTLEGVHPRPGRVDTKLSVFVSEGPNNVLS